MPQDVGEVYDGLYQDVARLHFEWKNYRELFGTNEQRVQLLNEAAPAFASCIQSVLQDSVYLGLTRLADPEKSCGRDNLTLKQLCRTINAHGNLQLCKQLESAIKDVERICRPFREHRNKRIAHSDYNQSTKASFDRPSRAEVEEALKAIRAAMNLVGEHYDQSTCAYEHVIFHGGGEALLYCVRDGLRLESIRLLVEKGELRGEALVKQIVDSEPGP